MQFATSHKLYPYPNGWYVLSKSTDLLAGTIMPFTFMGEEIVLFRTEAGHIAAIHAYCPHLGANLGLGGKIIGENLRCPFHHFQFDVNGVCVKTGYDTPPPPKCKIPTWLVQEKNGLILIWHDAKNNPPQWEIAQLDWDGWSPLRTHQWTLKSHPQESTENSVDMGHFTIVHGYDDVRVLKEVEMNGPFLKARYAFQREGAFLGNKKIKAEFSFAIMGLGYSFVEVDLPQYGMETRNFVFARPIDSQNTSLTIALSVKNLDYPGKIHPVLKLVPKKLLRSIILSATFKGYKNDVQQDFFVWENKKYVVRPSLAKGDGPIGLYRKYVQQFYYPDLVEEYNSRQGINVHSNF